MLFENELALTVGLYVMQALPYLLGIAVLIHVATFDPGEEG